MFLKEKGQVIVVNCKRCGRKMPNWQRSAELEASHPFPFDRICGLCITEDEAKKAYPSAYPRKAK
jgi:hypothetical protein